MSQNKTITAEEAKQLKAEEAKQLKAEEAKQLKAEEAKQIKDAKKVKDKTKVREISTNHSEHPYWTKHGGSTEGLTADEIRKLREPIKQELINGKWETKEK